VAALSNNTIHHHFGRRGIAFMAPISKMIAYVVVCVHPPYPCAVVFYMFAGFGNGLEDSAWNAWIGDMANANEVLGFLHGFYGLGATLAPLIATSMITKGNLPWYSFYYILVSQCRRFLPIRSSQAIADTFTRLDVPRLSSLHHSLLFSPVLLPLIEPKILLQMQRRTIACRRHSLHYQLHE